MCLVWNKIIGIRKHNPLEAEVSLETEIVRYHDMEIIV
jgi:hypothetical protein